MIQIDETIFDEAGLSELTPEEKQRMLAYVYKTFETRMGIRLAEVADEDQLKKFTELADGGDEDKLLAWLEDAFPDFDKIAEQEISEIRGELVSMAQEVLDVRK